MSKKKCFYCDEYFDIEQEPYIKVNKVRYAHKECCENSDDYWIKQIKEYAAQVLGNTYKPRKVTSNLKKLNQELKIPYKIIYQSLTYWYDIKQNSPEKANGGIAIVEYIWEEANKYYTNIQEKQEKLKEYNLKDYIEESADVCEVKWEPPVRPKNYTVIDLR